MCVSSSTFQRYVYCRKLVRFRPKTKMAKTIKNSHFWHQKWISVGLYATIIFFSCTYFPVINWITLINYYFSYMQFSNILQFLLPIFTNQFQFNWNWFSRLPSLFLLQLTELTLQPTNFVKVTRKTVLASILHHWMTKKWLCEKQQHWLL